MNDMRERVMLLAYLSDFRRREDLELAYDAGTYGSASVLGLPDYGCRKAVGRIWSCSPSKTGPAPCSKAPCPGL